MLGLGEIMLYRLKVVFIDNEEKVLKIQKNMVLVMI